MSATTTGFIVFAHGSSVESANEAVRRVAADFASQLGNPQVVAAFLEGGKPDLDGAVDSLANNGATEILVLPYFLTLGMHLQRDLPRLVDAAAARHPGVHIRVAPPLDGHPRLTDILLERATEVAG